MPLEGLDIYSMNNYFYMYYVFIFLTGDSILVTNLVINLNLVKMDVHIEHEMKYLFIKVIILQKQPKLFIVFIVQILEIKEIAKNDLKDRVNIS